MWIKIKYLIRQKLFHFLSYIFVLFWKQVSWFSFLNFCFFYFILGWTYVGCHEYSLSNLYVRKIKSENHNWENYFSLWAGDLNFFLKLIFKFFQFFFIALFHILFSSFLFMVELFVVVEVFFSLWHSLFWVEFIGFWYIFSFRLVTSMPLKLMKFKRRTGISYHFYSMN